MRLNFCCKLPILIMVLITCIISPISSLAKSDEPNKIEQIVFFGDSLTDNGNLYSADFGYLPKSPPYYFGRFSNGEVWSEHVAENLFNKYDIIPYNYAFGGESVIVHNPTKGHLPYSLTASINSYLLRNILSDKSHTLFVIWIGANDYLFGSNDVEGLTTQITEQIKYDIDRLIYHDAKFFLIMNIPDISLTPYASKQEPEVKQNLHELVIAHNQKLNSAITELQQTYPDVNIHFYDMNSMFSEAVNNPEKFNKRFHIHIKTTKSSCWDGGYSLTGNNITVDEKEIAAELRAQLANQTRYHSLSAQSDLDVDQLAHRIATTPDLREAYRVTKRAMGDVPLCLDQDDYAFWDQLHPTRVVHGVFGKLMTAYIEANYPVVKG